MPTINETQLSDVVGATAPSALVTLRDDDGDIVDLSSATFAVRVGTPGSAASFNKTTGITGGSSAPNLTIAWAATGEIGDLAAGEYTCQVETTESSLTRIFQLRLIVRPAVTAA